MSAKGGCRSCRFGVYFSPMDFLDEIWAIVVKDVAAEWHTREIVSAMLVFGVLSLLVFSFALDLRGATARALFLASAVAILTALGMVFRYAPREATMGDIQRIFYFHVSSAWVGFFAFFVTFCAGRWSCCLSG